VTPEQGAFGNSAVTAWLKNSHPAPVRAGSPVGSAQHAFCVALAQRLRLRLRPILTLPPRLNLARDSDRSDSKQDYTNDPHANCLSGGLSWIEDTHGGIGVRSGLHHEQCFPVYRNAGG
jgi:hypothetical protein